MKTKLAETVGFYAFMSIVVLNLRKIQHTLSRLFGRILHTLPQQKIGICSVDTKLLYFADSKSSRPRRVAAFVQENRRLNTMFKRFSFVNVKNKNPNL